MKTLLIHGAGATPLTWTTVLQEMPGAVTFEYDVGIEPFADIVCRCVEVAEAQTEPVLVIGHSLGGIIAWHVAQMSENVTRGISVATPWGGSTVADVVSFFPGYKSEFFRTISRGHYSTVAPRITPSSVPWVNVVTTRGIFSFVKNDGVITVSSQEELEPSNSETIYIHHSHNEVVHSPEFLNVVRRYA